jgi:hypothetical protein
MKKILALSLLLLSSLTFGATLNPIQLLNPVGSTSGQVISSTGPTTAPAWTTVTLSGLPGTVAIANGGTGQTTQAAALTALLGSSTVPLANGGTGATTAANARTNLGLGTAATVNTGTSGATIPLLNGANTWAAAQTFSVRPTFNGATPYDSANLTIANYATLASPAFTGTATFAARPTFNGATPWDSTNLASPALTTGNLSQFASTTSAQLATLLSDETGSGSAVFALTPTITSPNVVGTISGGNAAAGSVGEYISSNVAAGSSVALTNNVPANITSISLTAGDWDVWGTIGTNPAGTTTQANTAGAITTTSATLPTSPNAGAMVGLPFSTAAGTFITVPVGTTRISISSTTTVYLVISSNFGVSTNSAYGFIAARRRR